MEKTEIKYSEIVSTLLKLAVPIAIQNLVTNFVNMLDNVMVGRIGTVEMTGVSIANKLIFVFNLCIFGVVSGIGIFGAQYSGKKDNEGVRNTFRFKIICCTAITAAGIILFLFAGNALVSGFLTGEGSPEDISGSLESGVSYLNIILIGLVPFAISNSYASTLRETGKTVFPMIAGISAVCVNLLFNYMLIFGKFGFSAYGVAGAAIATVISRIVEMTMLVIYTEVTKDDNAFIKDAYKTMAVPPALIKSIAIKGFPLVINETMWAAGMAEIDKCYSFRSVDVVAALNISSTFYNVFSVMFLSVGSAIGIYLGQLLGAGETDRAHKECFKLISVGEIISFVVCVMLFVAAPYIPYAYNTTDNIRSLATSFMRVNSILMPMEAFVNGAYFTLRSGGEALITMLFDSVFVWVINLPVAYVLARFSGLSIVQLFAVSGCAVIIKVLIGFFFVKKGKWIKQIVV